MHSRACVARVRRDLEALPGVRVREVRIGFASVDVDAGRESTVLEAIQNAGYQPHIAA
jgi:copper chaperone CopZ